MNFNEKYSPLWRSKSFIMENIFVIDGYIGKYSIFLTGI